MKVLDSIISAKQYAEDTGKSIQLIHRYLRADRELPGISEHKDVKGLGYVLVPDTSYRNKVAKIKKQKYLVVEK